MQTKCRSCSTASCNAKRAGSTYRGRHAQSGWKDNLLERITASRTRRTASSSMGNAEWARQRIVPGPITPPQCGLSPESRVAVAVAARPVLPPRALTPRAVAPSLLLLAPSRRAFALSFCRSPSLSAVTTTLRSQHCSQPLRSVTTSTAPAAHLGSVRP